MIVHKDNCVSRKSIIVFVRIKVFLAISIVAICNNHNEGSSQVFQGQVFQFKLFISLARNVMIIPNLRPNCPLHKSERNIADIFLKIYILKGLLISLQPQYTKRQVFCSVYYLLLQFILPIRSIAVADYLHVCSIYGLLTSLIGHFTKCGDNYIFFLRNGQIRRMQTKFNLKCTLREVHPFDLRVEIIEFY